MDTQDKENLQLQELTNLLDYILENKNIYIGESEIFTRDTLINIRKNIKNNTPSNFNLTKDQIELLITSFINGNQSFNSTTPNVIMNNKECIRLSIERNLTSINYIKTEDQELMSYAINLAIENCFILQENSSKYLKENYFIAINSIKNDVKSANYVNYYNFNNQELNNLINIIIEYGYTLDERSEDNYFLTTTPRIILSSLKKDPSTIKHIPKRMYQEPSIFKYLLLNGHEFSNQELKNIPLINLLDKEIMDYYFNYFKIYETMSPEYKEQFKQLLISLLNTSVTIENIKKIINSSAELEWRIYQKNNEEELTNIFGKICGYLQTNPPLNSIEFDLDFLNDMEEYLKDKYNILYDAMIEYTNIYNSNLPDKLEKIQSSKDTISKLSALYISKRKENHKKYIINNCLDIIKDYYKLNIEHPKVLKKINEFKQRTQFENLYRNNDQEIHSSLQSIAKKYYPLVSPNIIDKMIDYFSNDKYSDISNIESINEPPKYQEYQIYLKVKKLVNRLNSGYIDIIGIEVSKYKNYIIYSEDKEKYFYNGPSFTEEEIKEINQFEKYEDIFNKIKKDITYLIKTIKIEEETKKSIIDDLEDEFPFTDEYFIFNLDYISKAYDFNDLFNEFLIKPQVINEESYLDSNSYQLVSNLLVDRGLIWLLLIISRRYSYKRDSINILRYNLVNTKSINQIINNIKDIISLANEFKINLDNYEDIITLNQICTYATEEQIAILGTDVIKELLDNLENTEASIKEIINIATTLVCQMTKKNKSTVPYINGSTVNYKYSLYDSQDPTILLAGIKTDSCFRVSGVDNDFLHYCALNKNGFVIKITDYFGNFIARAAGFRNGNCVYLNQLRTIYDEGGNYYHGRYETETKEIIDTLRQACEDIVLESYCNKEEKNRIDYVFITQSYCLKGIKSTVSNLIEIIIGSFPMDRKSKDWKNFIENTKNLDEAATDNFFNTDYGEYKLICMYSSREDKRIMPWNIKRKDVKPVYIRPRNEIVITTTINDEITKKVNRVKAIDCYRNNLKFKNIDIPSNSLVCLGDNWFIIYHKGNIIDSCLLEYDEHARIEFNTTLNIISKNKQNKLNENNQFDEIESLKLTIREQHETTKKDIKQRILKRK